MPICIDCHAHFLPDTFVAMLRERGLADARKDEGTLDLARAVCGYAAETTRLPYFPLLYDLDQRTQLAERQGIDRQIVCLPPFYFAYLADPETATAICRAGNDALAATVARAPERFAAFATVPLQSPPAAVAELRRAVEELGCWGVEIGSSVGGAPLDAPALDVFWAACCELDVPVFMHPHHELGGERAVPYYLGNLFGNPSETGLIAARLIFAGVFERFPQLNMILAHGGGTLAAIAGRLDHGYRVRTETKTIPKPPSAYLSQLYFDIVTHDDALLDYLVRRAGVRSIVVGTDRPFDMGIDDPRGVVARIPGLSDEERAAILGGNARSFLSRFPSSGAEPPSSSPAAASSR
ncbi:MAG TPA: amidohydrolase family protein [Candidatus Elarobacter sp.]|jgi:aminocarboxymuconate-semialdehyde decarboxylase|nr:amidohydrolase family protein [Candidatus Elarobacter sp.]